MSPITTEVTGDFYLSALSQRMREAGMVMLRCDVDGQLAINHRSVDWMTQLLSRSPMIRRLLVDATATWEHQEHPESMEVVPGLWFAPVPLTARRRRTGYSIVALPTEELLDAEQFDALCQAAQMDSQLVRSLLAALPPARTCDVGRLIALARSLHDSELRLASNKETMESTGQQLAESYEEISLLYTIIQSMTVVQQPERFVTITCEELLQTLPYAWVGAQMANDPERLKKLAGRLIVAGDPNIPGSASGLGRGNEAQLHQLTHELLTITKADTPVVLEPNRNAEHQRFKPLGCTILVHPVTSDDRVIGILIAGDKRGPDTAASSVDMKLLGASASNMAIFLENAALYDDLNAMFLGTLEALTASIDAKDRYTCGHSTRVAHLTQQLAIFCHQSGIGKDLSPDRAHIAGLVHDVGKIGVPEHVLLKPGQLTEEEFDWIRRHPEMGYRILKDIPQIKDLLPGVLYHHERWDGRGYPDGLEGDEIPLIARMICLADAFDAMSSTRTYRSAMARDDVLIEIMRCAGTQFDPELAPIFVQLDFKKYDKLVAEHRAGKTADALLHRNAGNKDSLSPTLIEHLRRGEAA